MTPSARPRSKRRRGTLALISVLAVPAFVLVLVVGMYWVLDTLPLVAFLGAGAYYAALASQGAGDGRRSRSAFREGDRTS